MDVETTAKKFGIVQHIENKNIIDLIGETASLSFDAKVTNVSKLSDIRAVVLAWNSTADSPTTDVVSSWGAEGSNPTWATNFTAENTPADLNVTASWARYTIDGISIDTSGVTNLAVFIWQNNVATNDTAGVYLEVTNVKLEKNSIASEFRLGDFETELAKCQRYYQQSYDYATAPGTASDVGIREFYTSGHTSNVHTIMLTTYFPVSMRATPTVTSYDTAGNSARCTTADGVNDPATVSNQSTSGFNLSGTDGNGHGTRILKHHWTADAEL